MNTLQIDFQFHNEQKEILIMSKENIIKTNRKPKERDLFFCFRVLNLSMGIQKNPQVCLVAETVTYFQLVPRGWCLSSDIKPGFWMLIFKESWPFSLGLFSLFNGHINLHKLFYAKAILVEEQQWYYLNYRFHYVILSLPNIKKINKHNGFKSCVFTY